MQPTLTTSEFGCYRGRPVRLYSVVFPDKLEVAITNYGGIIQRLRVPNRRGKLEDIVLGYPTLEEYLADTYYLGAVIGRVANRIAGGKFSLEGKAYELARNNGPNHLHGGLEGFNAKVWQVSRAEATANEAILQLQYTSADGEEGYPGELKTTVTYRVRPNEIRVAYHAHTDAPTPVTLTQHSYFNLSGNKQRDILSHELALAAKQFLPVSEYQIPLGKPQPVANTPFNFTESRAVGQRISEPDEQLQRGAGYDHYWVLNAPGLSTPAAELYEPESGRLMQVFTTEPGLQVYTGNFLPKKENEGMLPRYRHGLCLETQTYPNAPNQPNFPSAIVKPGEAYRSETHFCFGIR